MSAQDALARFKRDLLDLLDETFIQHHGIYLDRGASLFETLAAVSAEQASIPVGGECATLAAQVEHVRFYLDVLRDYLVTRESVRVDWGEIWRTVGAVTPEQWGDSQARLRASYDQVVALVQGFEAWDGEDDIGGSMAILVHSAYHLGEIRQALCTLRHVGGSAAQNR